MSELRKAKFHISKMDCPSEERLIRLALEGKANIKKLDFDLSARDLTAFHEDSTAKILSLLKPLDLGATLSSDEEISEVEEILAINSKSDKEEMSVLKILLAINSAMFFIGMIGGWIAESTGLISDSLDMFADAAVFALSMYAVGRPLQLKKRAARLSGYLQMLLALFAFSEVIRRSIMGSEPEAPYMIVLASLSLIANSFCMYLLAKHRANGVHLKASWIFLSNDVIANAGVILAAIIVKFSGSSIPDLVIGGIIATVVLLGSLRILRAAR